jgi:hypothetical protein
VDPNLHQKQGINHLNRVLDYSHFVVEDGKAVVHLTPEDWQVVADTLFAMNTPREMLPTAILGFRLAEANSVIELDTEDCLIAVEPF